MLQIRTLGGFSLNVDGRPIIDMGSHKAEALLVYLAVEGGIHQRSVLLSLFWPESPQVQAATSLRVVLSILRKEVGDYLEISRETVRINPGIQFYLDLTDLETTLTGGQMGQALDIYRGDFLAGFQIQNAPEFEDWVRWEQERVNRSFRKALHAATSRALDAEDFDNGYSYVHRLLELDPLDDLAHAKYLLMLSLDGQRNAALAHYEQCCTIFKEELEDSPSPEIQALYQKILKGERLIWRGLSIPEHNLSVAQTSFIGRESELLQIEAMIRDPICRLMTLVAPGGSGKTRLALQAAANAFSMFQDGACFIPLEDCDSFTYLVPSIASALDFHLDTFATDLDPKNQLLDYVRDRSMLIVLDGFEHLVDGAGLLSEMLENAPKIQILVTSRQRLGLKGEWVYPLEGLPFPLKPEDALWGDSDALRLFIDRARQIDTDFLLTEVDLVPVTRICQLVEGMPLGIELAAGWISVLSPQELAEEMEKDLDLLVTSNRDIPEKHRSLRAVFDSTCSLLSDEQQEILSKLSIFRGGFDRQAALQIAGTSLSQLLEFLEKSLLKKTEAGRFEMHSLLRQFARQKLYQMGALSEELCSRYCQYYTNLLIQHQTDLMGEKMLLAREGIQRDKENIRAAVNWASLHWESQAVRKVFFALLSFYIVHGWHEGKDIFNDLSCMKKEALQAAGIGDPSEDAVFLSARSHQAFLLSNLGQIDESDAISKDCLDGLTALDLREELSECLHNLGVNASFRGGYESARDLLEEAILLGRESDHIAWPSYLLWLGHVYFLLGEYEQGLLSLQKCHELFDRKGTLWGTAFALSKMGLAADGLGNHYLAMQNHRDALSVFERINNPVGKGYSLSRMSMSAYFLAKYDLAVKYGLEGYQTFLKLGHRWGMCISWCRLGFALLGSGEIAQAKTYLISALKQSRRDIMLPLSLYALAGLACLLAHEREEQAAFELFQTVQRHPKTPAPYLEQAVFWMNNFNRDLLSTWNSVGSMRSESLTPLDEIIAQFVEQPEGHRALK